MLCWEEWKSEENVSYCTKFTVHITHPFFLLIFNAGQVYTNMVVCFSFTEQERGPGTFWEWNYWFFSPATMLGRSVWVSSQDCTFSGINTSCFLGACSWDKCYQIVVSNLCQMRFTVFLLCTLHWIAQPLKSEIKNPQKLEAHISKHGFLNC